MIAYLVIGRIQGLQIGKRSISIITSLQGVNHEWTGSDTDHEHKSRGEKQVKVTLRPPSEFRGVKTKGSEEKHAASIIGVLELLVQLIHYRFNKMRPTRDELPSHHSATD